MTLCPYAPVYPTQAQAVSHTCSRPDWRVSCDYGTICSMIELVDAMTFTALGHRYTSDERDTARFAVELHRDQSIAGRIDYDGEGFYDSLAVADCVLEELTDGLDVVSTPVHHVLGRVYLPYLVTMHERLPVHMYKEVCDVLQVRPFDLFWHGMSARTMLNASAGLELV